MYLLAHLQLQETSRDKFHWAWDKNRDFIAVFEQKNVEKEDKHVLMFDKLNDTLVGRMHVSNTIDKCKVYDFLSENFNLSSQDVSVSAPFIDGHISWPLQCSDDLLNGGLSFKIKDTNKIRSYTMQLGFDLSSAMKWNGQPSAEKGNGILDMVICKRTSFRPVAVENFKNFKMISCVSTFCKHINQFSVAQGNNDVIYFNDDEIVKQLPAHVHSTHSLDPWGQGACFLFQRVYTTPNQARDDDVENKENDAEAINPIPKQEQSERKEKNVSNSKSKRIETPIDRISVNTINNDNNNHISLNLNINSQTQRPKRFDHSTTVDFINAIECLNVFGNINVSSAAQRACEVYILIMHRISCLLKSTYRCLTIEQLKNCDNDVIGGIIKDKCVIVAIKSYRRAGIMQINADIADWVDTVLMDKLISYALNKQQLNPTNYDQWCVYRKFLLFVLWKNNVNPLQLLKECKFMVCMSIGSFSSTLTVSSFIVKLLQDHHFLRRQNYIDFHHFIKYVVISNQFQYLDDAKKLDLNGALKICLQSAIFPKTHNKTEFFVRKSLQQLIQDLKKIYDAFMLLKDDNDQTILNECKDIINNNNGFELTLKKFIVLAYHYNSASNTSVDCNSHSSKRSQPQSIKFGEMIDKLIERYSFLTETKEDVEESNVKFGLIDCIKDKLSDQNNNFKSIMSIRRLASTIANDLDAVGKLDKLWSSRLNKNNLYDLIQSYIKDKQQSYPEPTKSLLGVSLNNLQKLKNGKIKQDKMYSTCFNIVAQTKQLTDADSIFASQLHKYLFAINHEYMPPYSIIFELLTDFWNDLMKQLEKSTCLTVIPQFWQMKVFWGKIFPTTVLFYCRKECKIDDLAQKMIKEDIINEQFDASSMKSDDTSNNNSMSNSKDESPSVDFLERLFRTCTDGNAKNVPLLSFEFIWKAAHEFIDDKLNMCKQAKVIFDCCCIMQYCFQCSNMFIDGFDNVYAAYCGHSSENIAESMKRTIAASTDMNDCNDAILSAFQSNSRSKQQKSGSMNTNSENDIMKQQIIEGLISWRQSVDNAIESKLDEAINTIETDNIIYSLLEDITKGNKSLKSFLANLTNSINAKNLSSTQNYLSSDEYKSDRNVHVNDVPDGDVSVTSSAACINTFVTKLKQCSATAQAKLATKDPEEVFVFAEVFEFQQELKKLNTTLMASIVEGIEVNAIYATVSQANDICVKLNALTVSPNDDISKLSYVKGFILLSSLIRHLFSFDANLKECFNQLYGVASMNTENITLNEFASCIDEWN